MALPMLHRYSTLPPAPCTRKNGSFVPAGRIGTSELEWLARLGELPFETGTTVAGARPKPSSDA